MAKTKKQNELEMKIVMITERNISESKLDEWLEQMKEQSAIDYSELKERGVLMFVTFDEDGEKTTTTIRLENYYNIK